MNNVGDGVKLSTSRERRFPPFSKILGGDIQAATEAADCRSLQSPPPKLFYWWLIFQVERAQRHTKDKLPGIGGAERSAGKRLGREALFQAKREVFAAVSVSRIMK
jgi:hypothetical protein